MINWQDFKDKKLAIKCTSEKEKFFSDCANHEIYDFMGEKAKERDYFVCRLCFKDQFSEGRYELMSVDEWEIQPNMLFGKVGLPIVTYGG